MPDKLTALRIKQQDGTYSAQIPVGVLAENVTYNNDYDLKTVLGNVNMTKGNLQSQIDTKVGPEYVEGQISEDVSNWLDDNVTPVGSAVVVNASLSITGAAADAAVTGKVRDVVLNGTVTWTTVAGERISEGTGLAITDANYSRSDYIDVSNFGQIRVIMTSGTYSTFNAFYDENKNYIWRFGIDTTAEIITVPARAHYMRISAETSSFANIQITYSGKDQVGMEEVDDNNPDLISKYGYFLPFKTGNGNPPTNFHPIANGYNITGSSGTSTRWDNILTSVFPSELVGADHFYMKVELSDETVRSNVFAAAFCMQGDTILYTYYVHSGVHRIPIVAGTESFTIRAQVVANTTLDNVKIRMFMYKDYPIMDSIENMNASADRWLVNDIWPGMVKGTYTDYPNPYTHKGITFTWLNDKKTSLKISGTNDGTEVSFMNVYGGNSNFPEGMVPGKKYRITYKTNAPEVADVQFRIYSYNGNTKTGELVFNSGSSDWVCPSNCTSIIFRLNVQLNAVAKNSDNEDIIFSDIGFLECSDNEVYAQKEIEDYNCINLLENWYGLNNRTQITAQHGNVTFTSRGNHLYRVRGYTDSTFRFGNILVGTDSIPEPLEAGKTYYIDIKSSYTWLQVYHKLSGTSDFVYTGGATSSSGKVKITIPSNADGVIVRLYVQPNTAQFDELVSVGIYNAMTNEELSEKIEDAVRPNEYTFNNYAYTVTLNATPSITTDTNNYLASTGTTADRSADILAMLNSTGYCHLGPGDFYVKNIVMPDATRIDGCGAKTTVRLNDDDDSRFCFSLRSQCTIADMRLVGGLDSVTPTATLADRHGIIWEGTYSEDQKAPYRGTLDNLVIFNFLGGGVTLYNTGYSVNAGLMATNLWIHNCGAGINISYWSEFSKFTNVRCGSCYYGCINNGGNNVFVNCDFSSNREIALLMDNSQNQSPNNTHGSIIGCVFNHTASGGVSNSGIGIKILNCKNGFVFTGCQIFFSRIYIEDSDGIVISDSNFGNVNCDVSVYGGGAVLFANNMTQADLPVTIVDNEHVHFVNNYIRSTGAEWTA